MNICSHHNYIILKPESLISYLLSLIIIIHCAIYFEQHIYILNNKCEQLRTSFKPQEVSLLSLKMQRGPFRCWNQIAWLEPVIIKHLMGKFDQWISISYRVMNYEGPNLFAYISGQEVPRTLSLVANFFYIYDILIFLQPV